MARERLYLFDTTLRDGAQTNGVDFTLVDKLSIMRMLDELGVGADEAIAFEDSPNGVTAAKAAGLICVAVPNPITATLALDDADLVLESLADVPLAELLERF